MTPTEEPDKADNTNGPQQVLPSNTPEMKIINKSSTSWPQIIIILIFATLVYALATDGNSVDELSPNSGVTPASNGNSEAELFCAAYRITVSSGGYVSAADDARYAREC